MHYRLANEQDARRISLLVVPLVERFIAYNFEPSAAMRLLNSMTDESFRKYLRQGYQYHVVEHGGRLQGVVGTRDNRHLFHLFVSESIQGRGVGKTLWELARDACLAGGNKGEFTVNSSRYAVGFYRKLGFVFEGFESRQGVVSAAMRLKLAPPEPARHCAGQG